MQPVTDFIDRYKSYTAVAQQKFDVPFLLFDNADLQVFVDGVENTSFTVTADYQEDGNFATNGVVDLGSPVTATVELYGDRQPRRKRVFSRLQPHDANFIDSLNAEMNISKGEIAELHRDVAFLRLRSLPYVDLKSHSGAVIGGHGGPWAWLQEAYWEAADSSRPIFASPGVYDFGDEAEQVSPGVGNVKLYGQYGHTIFKVFEGTDASPLSLINDTDINSSKGFLMFEGLTFQGTFGDAGRTTAQGAAPLFLDHYKDLKLSWCQFKNLTNMATDLHFNEEAFADHCRFIDCGGDGFRTRESRYVSATNNYFCRMGDDSISNHGGKYVAGYDPDDGTPRREGLVANGNIFRDVSACITNLAGRQSNIYGNIANRFRNYFYYCSQDSSEGEHPAGNIKVTGNVGLNLITGIGAHVIISGVTPRGATVTSGVIPGQPHTDGTFENIWDWQNADALDTNDPFPPIENVEVSGNIFGRTLPAVTNYSDWGFGTQGSKTYGNDPAVTDTNLRPPASLNIAFGKVTTIKDNNVSHVVDGIFAAMQGGVTPAMLGSSVKNNVVRDFTSRGLVATGVSGKLIMLQIDGNTFEGDYRRLSANSNADGTYDSGSTTPTAIDLGTSVGAMVNGNIIASVARIMVSPENHICDDNIVLIDPAGYGDNAGNKGVRNMEAIEKGFKYIIADCDPTSATYGQIKNIMVESAADNPPSTGYYIKGHYVKNTNVGRLDRGALLGWKRVTTGSAHVPDVDWMADYLYDRNPLRAFVGVSPGTIADGATYPAGGVPATITVTGAALGAFVEMSFEGDRKGVTLDGWISATDTLSYLFTNRTGASQTIAGATLRAKVENL
jgi:hypothetical protein